MQKCGICGGMFDDIYEGSIVNEGMENEFRICGPCLETECNAGRIISCEACGRYFSASALHDEEIEGQSFTACPFCGKDVVEELTREEFAKEHEPDRYAVVVQSLNNSRGYVVTVRSGESFIKKLAEKVNLQGVISITYSQILLEEDEF